MQGINDFNDVWLVIFIYKFFLYEWYFELFILSFLFFSGDGFDCMFDDLENGEIDRDFVDGSEWFEIEWALVLLAVLHAGEAVGAECVTAAKA